MKNYFKKLWNGEEKLWRVFWLWGVLIGIISIFLIENFNYHIFNLFITFVYFPFFLIFLGKCAKNINTKNGMVKKLIKVSVFLFIVFGILAIIALIMSFLVGWILVCSGGDFNVRKKYFCY